jgi:hypothetical protein
MRAPTHVAARLEDQQSASIHGENMRNSALNEHIKTVLSELGGGEQLRALLMPSWERFEAFLLTHGPLPDHVNEIPLSVLRSFADHCDVYQADPDSLAKELMSVRLILLRMGYYRSRLDVLCVPSVRKRKKDEKNGKGGYARVRKPTRLILNI